MIAESTKISGVVFPILMMVGYVVLIVGGVLALFIYTRIARDRVERKRALDLRALAERMGFEDFNPALDERFVTGWGFLSRLSQGADRYAFNILRGIYNGQQLFVFDYHFQSGSGKNQEEHRCTMLMLVFKEIFPQLTIGPENFGLKIAEALGMANDIQFESAEFSKRFCVRSPDKKFAYDVCNPQMIDYLLSNPGLEIEIQGPCLLLVFEPRLPGAQIEFNLQRLAEIRLRLPAYLFAASAEKNR